MSDPVWSVVEGGETVSGFGIGDTESDPRDRAFPGVSPVGSDDLILEDLDATSPFFSQQNDQPRIQTGREPYFDEYQSEQQFSQNGDSNQDGMPWGRPSTVTETTRGPVATTPVANLDDVPNQVTRALCKPHCREGMLAWSFAFGFTLEAPLVIMRRKVGEEVGNERPKRLDTTGPVDRIHVLLNGELVQERNDDTVSNYSLPDKFGELLEPNMMALVAVVYATQHVVLRGSVQTEPTQMGGEPQRKDANDYLFPGEPVYICMTKGDTTAGTLPLISFYTHGTDGPMEKVIAALTHASAKIPKVANFLRLFYEGADATSASRNAAETWESIRGDMAKAAGTSIDNRMTNLAETQYAELEAEFASINTTFEPDAWWLRQTTFHSALTSCFNWGKSDVVMNAALIVAIPSVEWATMTVPDQRAKGVAMHLAGLLRYAVTSSNVTRPLSTDQLKFILRPASGRPLDPGLESDFRSKFSQMTLEDKLAFVRNGAPTSLYGGLGLFRFPDALSKASDPMHVRSIDSDGNPVLIEAARHPVVRYLKSKPVQGRATGIGANGSLTDPQDVIFGIPQLGLLPSKDKVEWLLNDALAPNEDLKAHIGSFDAPPPEPLGTATQDQRNALAGYMSGAVDLGSDLSRIMHYVKGDYHKDIEKATGAAKRPQQMSTLEDELVGLKYPLGIATAIWETYNTRKPQDAKLEIMNYLGLTPKTTATWEPKERGGGQQSKGKRAAAATLPEQPSRGPPPSGAPPSGSSSFN